MVRWRSPGPLSTSQRSASPAPGGGAAVRAAVDGKKVCTSSVRFHTMTRPATTGSETSAGTKRPTFAASSTGTRPTARRQRRRSAIRASMERARRAAV